MIDFAKAPAGATHYYQEDFAYLKPFRGDEWWVWEDKEWHKYSLSRIAMMSIKEIPAREIELNRLADILIKWPRSAGQARLWLHDSGFYWRSDFVIINEGADNQLVFPFEEWQARRALRHPESNSSEWEIKGKMTLGEIEGYRVGPAQDEWVDGLPPVDCECEVFNLSEHYNNLGERCKSRMTVTPIGYDGEIVVYKRHDMGDFDYDYSHKSNFRPIDTRSDEEKVKESFISCARKAVKDTDRFHPLDEYNYIYSVVCDWLTKSGVDLSPLIK